MPVPVSVTLSATSGPRERQAVGSRRGDAPRPLTLAVRERERPAPRHRVARVDAEVGDHLLELARIGDDVAQRRVEMQLKLDVLADEPPEHAAHLVHDRVEIHDRGCSTCFRLNASSWRTSPAARWAARPISCRSSRRGSARRSPDDQELGVAQDGRQQVVEVVGDAARELTDRLHLLRLPELVLEALPVGDVPQVGQQSRPAARRRPGRPRG